MMISKGGLGGEDFIHSQGMIWLPHILRRLANRFIEASDAVLTHYGVIVPSRAVSTVHLLHSRGPQAITDIAAVTGQSHPLVINHVKRLKALGLVRTKRDAMDGRRTLVVLTPKGREQAEQLIEARTSFVAAYEKLMEEAEADIFDAAWRIEAKLRRVPFAERILQEQNRLENA